MVTAERAVPEMALPSTALITLRDALRREAGPLATTHALHAAGFEAGERLFPRLLQQLGGEMEGMSRSAFWKETGDFFARRGWGSLSHRNLHPAVGILASRDWSEAGEEGGETQPSCAFSAGALAGLLSQASGGPVAVLEVSCRARGEEECAFAFGEETVIHELYGHLLDGASLEDGLGRL